MQQILYLLFGCYLLPLAAIVFSAFASRLFETEAGLVSTTAAISAKFLDVVLTAMGALLIPFLTAYAVELRNRADHVPKDTKRLIYFLVCVFTISFGLYGIIVANEARLVDYGPQVFEVFKNTSATYIKELLGYIAVVLGVTAKANSSHRQRAKNRHRAPLWPKIAGRVAVSELPKRSCLRATARSRGRLPASD